MVFWYYKNTKKVLKSYANYAIVKAHEITYYGGRWVTGVPPGLQNQCGALRASWVGSIPTCPRQKKSFIEFIYR